MDFDPLALTPSSTMVRTVHVRSTQTAPQEPAGDALEDENGAPLTDENNAPLTSN